MNHFKQLCQTRHSVRTFTQEPVGEALLKEILEVVQTAPSAGNLQAYEIVIVKSSHLRERLSGAAYGQHVILHAPVVLAFLALPLASGQRYKDRGEKLYSIQDATIACTYAMLAASSLGLSSTWVGAFNDAEVRQILQASRDQIPVALLPLGYAAEKPYQTPRRDLIHIAREL